MSNKFDGVYNLAHSVSVFVPSTEQTDRPVDNSAMVAHVQTALSAIFGGNTASPAIGAWVADNGQLVCEPVTVCKSNAETLTDEALDTVYDLARHVKTVMSQQAVSVEVDGRLYFV